MLTFVMFSILHLVMRRFAFALFCMLAAAAGAAAQTVRIPEIKPLKEVDEEIMPAEKNGDWGYANAKGKMIIKAAYDEVEPFVLLSCGEVTMGVARIRFGQKWNYLTRDRRYVFTFDYDSLTPFDDGGNCLGVIGEETVLLGVTPLDPGKTKTLPSLAGVTLATGLQKVEAFRANGLAWALRDGKWGMLDRQGNWVVEPKYDTWKQDLQIGMYLVGQDGKLGCVDEGGAERIPVRYDAVSYDGELGLVRVALADKVGLLSQGGLPVLDPEYEELNPDADRRIVARKDGKIGIFERDGNTRYPFVFDEIPTENAAGYVEVWDGDVPALYLPGRAMMTAKAMDDALLQDLGPEEYAASPRLPAWLKSHLRTEPQMVVVTTDLPGEPTTMDLSAVTDSLRRKVTLADKPLGKLLSGPFQDTVDYWIDGEFVYAGYLQADGLYGFDVADLTDQGRNWHGTTEGDFTFLKRERIVAEDKAGERGAVRSLAPRCFSIQDGPHIPVLRYEYHYWGGRNVVTLGCNIFPGEDGAPNWNVPVRGGETIELGDFMHSSDADLREVHSVKVNPAGSSGIAVYEMQCQVVEYKDGKVVSKGAPETVSYGLIGLTRPYFTQALFSEARAPQGASTEVTVNGVKSRLTLNQIRDLDPFAQPDEDEPVR